MNKIANISLITVFAGFFGAADSALADGDVNVYSYRQPDLIQPVLDAFTATTGITVNVLFLDTGLIERMKIEGENSPVDVILTTDIARLNELTTSGVVQPLDDAAIEAAIPAKFRDPAGQWFGLGMDARVVYAATARFAQKTIAYEELAEPKWKGKVCIRDGQHSSNLGLFADMIAAHGADKTGQWLAGLKDNLARRPSGSDSSQIQAIAEGKCDIALGNASTLAAMLQNDATPDEQKWASATRVILPDADLAGTYANISGMALARHAPNRDNAVKLMEFLATKQAQQLYADKVLEYPVVPGAEPGQAIRWFGILKPDRVSMSDVIKYRDKASELVDKVGFNDGPQR